LEIPRFKEERPEIKIPKEKEFDLSDYDLSFEDQVSIRNNPMMIAVAEKAKPELSTT